MRKRLAALVKGLVFHNERGYFRSDLERYAVLSVRIEHNSVSTVGGERGDSQPATLG